MLVIDLNIDPCSLGPFLALDLNIVLKVFLRTSWNNHFSFSVSLSKSYAFCHLLGKAQESTTWFWLVIWCHLRLNHFGGKHSWECRPLFWHTFHYVLGVLHQNLEKVKGTSKLVASKTSKVGGSPKQSFFSKQMVFPCFSCGLLLCPNSALLWVPGQQPGCFYHGLGRNLATHLVACCWTSSCWPEDTSRFT